MHVCIKADALQPAAPLPDGLADEFPALGGGGGGHPACLSEQTPPWKLAILTAVLCFPPGACPGRVPAFTGRDSCLPSTNAVALMISTTGSRAGIE